MHVPSRIRTLRQNASRKAVLDAMGLTVLDFYRRYVWLAEYARDSNHKHTDRMAASQEGREAWDEAMRWEGALNHIRRLDGLEEFSIADELQGKEKR
jgi:hypothetical protein